MRGYQVSSLAGIDALQCVDLPEQQPGSREVLVRWHAWSLNYRDLLLIEGNYTRDLPLPFTPLSDGAGEIVAVGTEVTEWKPGDRVVSHYFVDWQDGPGTPEKRTASLGYPLPGLLAEYSVVPGCALVSLPSYLTYAEGSTLPIAGVTAWNALFPYDQRAPVPGDTALLEGTGGVSIFALQLAHAAGLRTIITSSSDEKLARARTLGADATINYRSTPDWAGEVRRLTDGRGADLVIDIGGASTLNDAFRATCMGGTVALVGVIGGAKVEIDVPTLFSQLIRIRGIGVGSRAELVAATRAIAARQIHPVIDREFAFEETRAAFRRLKAGAHFGKIVIRASSAGNT
jgi:NADPH:quinone reductase-like Zn-dependent oxidoreductase